MCLIINLPTISVTRQSYETYGMVEPIINGNDAILKCSVPSFVADFVSVVAWIDSEGNELGGGAARQTNPGNLFAMLD